MNATPADFGVCYIRVEHEDDSKQRPLWHITAVRDIETKFN